MTGSSDTAYQSLLTRILSGEYPAGTRLREEALAASLAISRTPVRQALQRLQAEGLVQMQHNRGATVVGYGDRQVDQILELRSMLEGYAARQAAAHIDEEQLAEMSSLCEAMEAELVTGSAPRFQLISELNLEFHRAIHTSSANQYLVSVISGIIRFPLVVRSFSQYSMEEMHRSFSHHRELVAALGARDGTWAESVMHAHVSAAHVSLRRTRIDGMPAVVAVDGEAR